MVELISQIHSHVEYVVMLLLFRTESSLPRRVVINISDTNVRDLKQWWPHNSNVFYLYTRAKFLVVSLLALVDHVIIA